VARVFAALAKWDPAAVRSSLQSGILEAPPSQQSSLALLALVEDAPEAAASFDLVTEIASKIIESTSDTPPHVARPARLAVSLLSALRPRLSSLLQRDLLRHMSPFAEDAAIQDRL
jgi:hypothetical protein